MQIFRFVTMDDKKVTCWCETNILKVFRDFMQYILDSCNNPEDFLLWDVQNDKVLIRTINKTEQKQRKLFVA